MKANVASMRNAVGATPARVQRARPCGLRLRAARESSLQLATESHTLPDGVTLEVISTGSSKGKPTGKPPLVFLHGSYHAAWCYAEHFLPLFGRAGWAAHALSFRGQGGRGIAAGAKVGGTLDSHAADVASYVASLPAPPVVIAHSFGGLVLQKYLLGPLPVGSSSSNAAGNGTNGRNGGSYPRLAGAGFLCSSPPSGNSSIVGRLFKATPLLSTRLTWAFITKSFTRNADACREMFFSPDLPPNDLERYQQQITTCSPVRLIDLSDVNKQVPLPPARTGGPPVFVLGAENDVIVDPPAVAETAAYFGVRPVMVPRMAHDCMLDTRWRGAAEPLMTWLEELGA